jgi:oxygen-dependent protoporphyrinogen oxidase
VNSNGFRFELGPQSFLSTDRLLELTAALNLNDQLLYADARAPRYILMEGRLIPAPLSPPAHLTKPVF